MHRTLRDRLAVRLTAVPVADAPGSELLAAVLVPVIDGREPSLVFTQRADELPRHPGEISFPGGLAEERDGELARTALREAHEELGLDPSMVEVVGALAPIHTRVSGILVVPFVGFLEGRPALTPNTGEIAEVLEYPLRRLAAAEARVEWSLGDERVYRGVAYDMDGRMIWGATAEMLHELLRLVRSETPWMINTA
jgi:8-oxo-dGTP pyrophosphatase MutT (NUDIX family)